MQGGKSGVRLVGLVHHTDADRVLRAKGSWRRYSATAGSRISACYSPTETCFEKPWKLQDI